MYKNFANRGLFRRVSRSLFRGDLSAARHPCFQPASISRASTGHAAVRAFSSTTTTPGCGPHKRNFSASGSLSAALVSRTGIENGFDRPDTHGSPVPAPTAPSVRDKKLVLQEPRVYNFSAGPAAGSERVMSKVQKEWMNYEDTGMGFVEISHRDVNGPVQNCMVETQELFRELLNIPSNYHVLFMHGGAHLQFSAVPLNLSKKRGPEGTNGELSHAQYVDTGFWADRSAGVAHEWMKVNLENAPADKEAIYCSTERGFLKPVTEWQVNKNADYVYFCMNETIAGLEYKWDPDLAAIGCGHIPLVCDATSTLMSRPMDVSKYGVIFASSGKNLGPAGVTTVIVRDDLVGRGNEQFLKAMPMLDYAQQVNSQPIQNVYNTPPTFNIYMLNHMLKDYRDLGGLEYMEDKAEFLSGQCYQYLDSNNNKFFQPEVSLEDFDAAKYGDPRSRMNVCFRIGGRAEDIGEEARKHNMALEKKFTKEAAEKFGIHQLMGHPVFGGLRITLYNPMEGEAVETALAFMEYFAAQHGYECAGSDIFSDSLRPKPWYK